MHAQDIYTRTAKGEKPYNYFAYCRRWCIWLSADSLDSKYGMKHWVVSTRLGSWGRGDDAYWIYREVSPGSWPSLRGAGFSNAKGHGSEADGDRVTEAGELSICGRICHWGAAFFSTQSSHAKDTMGETALLPFIREEEKVAYSLAPPRWAIC